MQRAVVAGRQHAPARVQGAVEKSFQHQAHPSGMYCGHTRYPCAEEEYRRADGAAEVGVVMDHGVSVLDRETRCIRTFSSGFSMRQSGNRNDFVWRN